MDSMLVKPVSKQVSELLFYSFMAPKNKVNLGVMCAVRGYPPPGCVTTTRNYLQQRTVLQNVCTKHKTAKLFCELRRQENLNPLSDDEAWQRLTPGGYVGTISATTTALSALVSSARVVIAGA